MSATEPRASGKSPSVPSGGRGSTCPRLSEELAPRAGGSQRVGPRLGQWGRRPCAGTAEARGREAADDIAVDTSPRPPLLCPGPSTGTDSGHSRGQCVAHPWPVGFADMTNHSEETGHVGVLGSGWARVSTPLGPCQGPRESRLPLNVPLCHQRPPSPARRHGARGRDRAAVDAAAAGGAADPGAAG